MKSITLFLVSLFMIPAHGALDAPATVTALRMANTITGGFMPSSDPLFAQMVAKVQAGDRVAAALLAAKSPYFANYLGRRLALQMQSPALDASASADNDSTAFIIAHFVGAGGIKPSISTLFSENATYLANISVAGILTPSRVAGLSLDQLDTLDWTSALTRIDGQTVKNITGTGATRVVTSVALPPKHVGGFITLSDRGDDKSFAMYGAAGGTNLRMIEGLWQIATGLQLTDTMSNMAGAQKVPRFVPEYDPNFFKGQGQASCISCHGGGMASVNHGYSAVADIFDYDSVAGLVFNANPSTAQRKSLGSDPTKRATNLTCNLVANPTAVCNPDSEGVDANQGWDVGATWSSIGVLDRMGWKGPTTGQGLNALGIAIGQSTIVYEFLVKRVVGEICPMGIFTARDVAEIASAANPNSTPAGTDDIRTIVAMVAAHASCQ